MSNKSYSSPREEQSNPGTQAGSFTTEFPISLQEEFDGTMEIPYAPDLRPDLPERKKPSESKKKQALAASGRSVPQAKRKPKHPRAARRFLVLVITLVTVLAVAFLGSLLQGFLKNSPPEEGASPSDADSSSELPGEVSGQVSGDASSDNYSDPPQTSSDSASASEVSVGSASVRLTLDITEEFLPGENGDPIFTTRLAIPTLLCEEAPRLQAEMNRRIALIFDRMKANAKELADNYAANSTAQSVPGAYECNCSIACSRPDILTLIVDSYLFNGGATSLSTIDCFNFDMRDGHILELDELISSTGALAELAISLIDRSLVWTALYEKYIRDNLCDSWYFSANGLVLLYQKYSIGPGASGSIEVVIPSEQLEGLLNADFRTPASSFSENE